MLPHDSSIDVLAQAQLVKPTLRQYRHSQTAVVGAAPFVAIWVD